MEVRPSFRAKFVSNIRGKISLKNVKNKHYQNTYLDIFLHLLLEDGEEDAASEQVAEVGRHVEGEEPSGAPDAQPALDPVTPGARATQRGVISLLLPI